MTLSRKELDDRVLGVLDEHLGLQDLPEVARHMMTRLFSSALEAARENRIGRSLEAEKNLAAKQLEDAAKQIQRTLKKMSELNPLARELLAREKGDLLDLSNYELEGYFWAGTEIGKPGAVQDWIDQLDLLLQSVEKSRSELEAKLKKFGRGAPPKHGPLAVAQICTAAFQEYVGQPAHPTWNDYSETTEGRLYCFVKDIFAVGEIKAGADEFTRQAIDIVRKNNTNKN